jgi:hypothetical protein
MNHDSEEGKDRCSITIFPEISLIRLNQGELTGLV